MIQTMQVRCPSSALYISKHVMDDVQRYFQQQVLYAANEIPINSRPMRDLLGLLRENQRSLDCEWEGEIEVAIFSSSPGVASWNCPNCGTYNQTEMEGE